LFYTHFELFYGGPKNLYVENKLFYGGTKNTKKVNSEN